MSASSDNAAAPFVHDGWKVIHQAAFAEYSERQFYDFASAYLSAIKRRSGTKKVLGATGG